MDVKDKLVLLNEKIKSACDASGRNPEDITIVAVTKYVSNERAQEALEAGLIHLGENRDDGLDSKWEHLKDKPVWHFIGSLQSRKVKNIIDKVSYIHSLDRKSLAKEINKRASKPVSCFVQVNISGEESKHGLPPHEVTDFIEGLSEFENIKVDGLMTMMPNIDNEEELRGFFKEMKRLQTKIAELNLKHAPCQELSMGMSNDYMIAIEEGATFIRVGTALVGED
ncbi:YggS family pyridoxal phosphate-dependent enzyme [Rossellomorea vietnamensis]|uniref:Pyridoxal phosphate homeostasis protein n=1 Tax=Rossellomorea vietnamensis TaxID=218284 RepID=A0A5D4MAF9_9BACI|nr:MULTISPECIES: YggS family pyridoxal phosphate-dependent enzyme [Bacillaceae]TYR98478.1 YggS family pyridoxal phosphate-dependent enzyme [Rossellomorea vietnamensis]